MPLERLLQINMAALAALGALLLGMGARSEGPPLLVIVAASLSVWLTDVTGRFSLGRRVSNVLMLAAAVVALLELWRLRSELQALNFAWLMIFIQVTLFFQRKDGRSYWLLVMLSLLQVVVATLFSQGIWFGILLTIYMLLGFSAMTLLLLHSQWERHGRGVQGSGFRVRASGSPGDRVGGGEFTGQPAVSQEAALGPHLFRRLGFMGLQTVGLTLVLFFALPRFGQLSWRSAVVSTQPVVGFSDRVTLGALGQIIESREAVMQVRFRRRAGDPPQPLNGDVYLQGALLMDYAHSQWRAGEATMQPGTEPLQKPDVLPTGLMRQEFKIEGMDTDELFFVPPYIAINDNAWITVDHAQARLRRDENLRSRRFEYTLGTTAIVDGEQSPLRPSTKFGPPPGTVASPREMPGLVALAQRWLKESGLPQQDRVGRARYLEQQLARSGQFQYSLVGQHRDPTIDPIEDFVTKHPQGHCEYFATALTLMLRSQGIPARMVCGYKTDHDAWDTLGGYYQVRQFHAHTWVEVYLNPSLLKSELSRGREQWTLHGDWPWLKDIRKDGGGAWLRLDPTPAGFAGERVTWFTPVRRTMDWLDSAWSNYVLELDTQRQRDAIYQPIAKAATNLWQQATDPKRWRARLNSLSVALYLNHLSREAAWLLLGVAGLVLAAVLAAAGWLLARVARRLWARRSGKGSPRRRVEIEFYRRFEALLARRGLARTPGQTQREFAAAAAARLAGLGGDGRLAALPGVVVEAFYRVRFGRTPLDNLQTQTVELALAEIAGLPTYSSRSA